MERNDIVQQLKLHGGRISNEAHATKIKKSSFNGESVSLLHVEGDAEESPCPINPGDKINVYWKDPEVSPTPDEKWFYLMFLRELVCTAEMFAVKLVDKSSRSY